MFWLGFFTASFLFAIFVLWWWGTIGEIVEKIYNYYLLKTGWQKFDNNYPPKSMNLKIKFDDKSSCWAYFTKNNEHWNSFAIPEDYKFKKKVYWKPNN